MITRMTASLLACLLWLALWPGAARGQSPELQEAYDRFMGLYDKDYYEEALPFAEKALRLSNQEFGLDHPMTATLANDVAVLFGNMAAIYQAQGKYAEAEALYQRALAIYEKVLGPEQPQLATGLENLAALLRETGRKEQAAELVARAKSIRAKYAQDN